MIFLCPNFGHNLQKPSDQYLVNPQSFNSKIFNSGSSKAVLISDSYLPFSLTTQS